MKLEINSPNRITYRQLADLLAIGSLDKGDSAYRGGIRYIVVSYEVFTLLVSIFPEMFNMDDAQNDSPTMKEFLDICKPGDYFLTYVVDDSRDDKRVTIEGAIVSSPETLKILRGFHPDEDDKFGIGEMYRLWWD